MNFSLEMFDIIWVRKFIVGIRDTVTTFWGHYKMTLFFYAQLDEKFEKFQVDYLENS